MMFQTKQKSGELELRQAFRLFDADNDGFITFDDLKRVMRNCGENLSDSELKHMFTKADVNNDNRVDMKGNWLLVTSWACSHLRLKHGLPAEINKTSSPPRPAPPRPAPPQSPCCIQRVDPGWLASLVDLVTAFKDILCKTLFFPCTFCQPTFFKLIESHETWFKDTI